MLRTVKPKNARVKRALKNREAKVEENTKTAMFIRGSQTSKIVNDALSDLYLLKKPDAVNFTKKNQIHPFDDETTLEFFSQKNDASLMLVGSHSKKRPHNLVFVRMFDNQVLDMMELGIEKAVAMSNIKGSKCAVGMKPLLLFNGELFDTNTDYKNLKNLLLDFFRGQDITSVNLKGLEHIISVTAGPLEKEGRPGLVYLRVYTVQMKKSGSRIPRVEVEEMGPSLDLRLRRTKLPKDEVWKQAIRVPKELRPKKVKNVSRDDMGDQYARIHLGRQDLSKMQTRKMKGLKRGMEEGEDDVAGSKKRRTAEEEED
ncbi:Brix domain-containing protein [Jimgerdemannia flammicorona]|uniref:Ribosome production factor 2 homolog n=1 Tax=Jimgerdemannia flammicorona TaxID=994334 RepID=A0A433QHB9_9FUNG|nr:Brix domain-containing protein [Jimgerdemannia flammicorona]